MTQSPIETPPRHQVGGDPRLPPPRFRPALRQAVQQKVAQQGGRGQAIRIVCGSGGGLLAPGFRLVPTAPDSHPGAKARRARRTFGRVPACACPSRCRCPLRHARGADEPFYCSSPAPSASRRPRLPPTRAQPLSPLPTRRGTMAAPSARALRGELRTPPGRLPWPSSSHPPPGAPGPARLLGARRPHPEPFPCRYSARSSGDRFWVGPRPPSAPRAPPHTTSPTDRRPAARSPRPSPRAVATHEAPPLFNPTFTPPSLPPFAANDRRKLHDNAARLGCAAFGTPEGPAAATAAAAAAAPAGPAGDSAGDPPRRDRSRARRRRRPPPPLAAASPRRRPRCPRAVRGRRGAAAARDLRRLGVVGRVSEDDVGWGGPASSGGRGTDHRRPLSSAAR